MAYASCHTYPSHKIYALSIQLSKKRCCKVTLNTEP